MSWILAKARVTLASLRPVRRNVDGNASIIFGFCLIPLIGLVGLGVDYGVALTDKSKLDNAADATALSAVATAKAYVAANPNDTNLTSDAITAGYNRAMNAFTVNTGNLPFAQIPTPTVQLTRNQQTFTAVVTYATNTQNHFGQLFGKASFPISGTTVASADIPSYLDFYLLVDVSGSMGLPSTSAGQTQLASMNNDNYAVYQQGCQFACHFPGYQGWTLAEANSIQLRSGAVNTAVCGLLSRAATPAVANQYRVGIYPFVTMMTNQFAPLSGNYSNLSVLANCSASQPKAFDNLLDTGTTQFPTNGNMTTGTGSGGTNLGPSPNDSNSIFTQMQSEVVTYTQSNSAKDGSSAVNSRPFVFLVTDGMENPQHYASNRSAPYMYQNGSFDGLRAPTALDPAQCTALKNAGVTISVLYIPYVPLVYTQDPYNENAAANAAIQNLPITLQKCSGSNTSSANFFYTASSPSAITSALNSMFNQAVQVAHLQQ